MPPKKKQTPRFSAKSLLALLKESGSPLPPKTIFGTFQADASLKKVIKSTLAQLAAAGQIQQVGKSFGLLENLPQVTGVLDVRRSGVGFVIPENRQGRDVFIHPGNFGEAWPGDKVVAVVDSQRRKDSPKAASCASSSGGPGNSWSGSAAVWPQTATSATPRTPACPSTPWWTPARCPTPKRGTS